MTARTVCQCGATLGANSLRKWDHAQCGATLGANSLRKWDHAQCGATLGTNSLRKWDHAQCSVHTIPRIHVERQRELKPVT